MDQQLLKYAMEAALYSKQADGVMDGLSHAWQGLNPTVQTGLMGAAGGAGLGLLSSYGQPKEDRHPLQSMLTGAVGGGALGAGGRYLYDNYKPTVGQMGLGKQPQLDAKYLGQAAQKLHGANTPESAQQAFNGISPEMRGPATDVMNDQYGFHYSTPLEMGALGGAANVANHKLEGWRRPLSAGVKNMTGVKDLTPSQSGIRDHVSGPEGPIMTPSQERSIYREAHPGLWSTIQEHAGDVPYHLGRAEGMSSPEYLANKARSWADNIRQSFNKSQAGHSGGQPPGAGIGAYHPSNSAPEQPIGQQHNLLESPQRWWNREWNLGGEQQPAGPAPSAGAHPAAAGAPPSPGVAQEGMNSQIPFKNEAINEAAHFKNPNRSVGSYIPGETMKDFAHGAATGMVGGGLYEAARNWLPRYLYPDAAQEYVSSRPQ